MVCLWCFIRDKGRSELSIVKWKNMHMDMLSENINKTEVMYQMPQIVLGVDDVRGALGKVKKGKQPGPNKLKGRFIKA